MPKGENVEQDGLFATSNVTVSADAGAGLSQQGAGPLPRVTGTKALGAATAKLHASATVRGAGIAVAVCVSFSITAAGGATIASTPPARLKVPAAGSAVARATIENLSVSTWSPQSPNLYTVHVGVYKEGSGEGGCEDVAAAEPIDWLSTTHGFRTLRYDANGGFFLNSEHFKVRGFCDHNDFGVVGMAVPERVALFRAQMLRAVGGNGRRMSHNPPDVATLAIYDRLGVVVMDENRLFANSTKYVDNMGDLVRRDRNHPSVVIWSFCNEAGCERGHEAGGPRFADVTARLDGSRPTLANMFTFGDLLSRTVDVQGFSHQSREKLDACHVALPDKPIFMSECCSCNTERDEDVGCETTHDDPKSIGCRQTSFNARCAQVNMLGYYRSVSAEIGSVSKRVHLQPYLRGSHCLCAVIQTP
jgi:hypothetical protein